MAVAWVNAIQGGHVSMTYWLVFLVITLILNTYTSFYLSRRDDLETSQKVAQVILVWLIPLISAICLLLFYKSQDDENDPDKGSFGGGPSNSIGTSHSGD